VFRKGGKLCWYMMRWWILYCCLVNYNKYIADTLSLTLTHWVSLYPAFCLCSMLLYAYTRMHFSIHVCCTVWHTTLPVHHGPVSTPAYHTAPDYFQPREQWHATNRQYAFHRAVAWESRDNPIADNSLLRGLHQTKRRLHNDYSSYLQVVGTAY
jgi:hypothetical protein